MKIEKIKEDLEKYSSTDLFDFSVGEAIKRWGVSRSTAYKLAKTCNCRFLKKKKKSILEKIINN